jgi:uncharacterized protein YbjT (DUF2867 family)
MTTVLVTGGTGDLGSKLVERLLARGDNVRILSRKPRPQTVKSTSESPESTSDSPESTSESPVGRGPSPDAAQGPSPDWATGDIETGAGLADAVKGTDIVFHCATGAGLKPKVDPIGTKNLLDACKDAGTPHFFYISIVGIERLPLAYYKAKLDCEQLIENSGVPWSNLRATQFHQLLDNFLRYGMLPQLGKIPFVRLIPKSFKFQPIETGEVADRMVEHAQKGPSGRLPDLGGPDITTFGKLAKAWQRATGDSKPTINLPMLGGLAAGFKAAYNCTPDHAEGKMTWREWLDQKYGARTT